MPLLPTVHGRGTTAAKPAAAAANEGYLYQDTTLGRLERSNGTTWDVIGSAAAATAFGGAFAYHGTTQSFAASTLTTMSFNSESFDTATYHDNATNNSRLTVPTTGYYRVSAGIWYATTSGTNYVLIDKNGLAVYIRGGVTAQNGGGSGLFIVTPPVSLTAADYLTVVGYHTEAGSIATGDTGTTPSQQNYFGIEFLGT